MKTRSLILCALFTALITAGAFIRIPLPVVPFTLQLTFVLAAGTLLGPKLGLCSVLAYIFMGLLGLPVFAEGGGIAYVLKPSFGYIIGFALGAYVTGKIAHKDALPSFKRLLFANFAGLVIIYAVGMVYLYLMSNFYLGRSLGLWSLLLYGLLLTVPGDIALCIPTAILAKRLLPTLNKKVSST